jgi:hypothetical protein
VWNNVFEDPSKSGRRVKPEPSRYFTLLLEAFIARGIQADRSSTSYVQQRIQLIGKAERRKLRHLSTGGIDIFDAIEQLGWGFTITEFLTAPAAPTISHRVAVCSLGAVFNLMVVICDRLLDSGESVDSVLPPDQLAAGGGDGSPVMLLLKEYYSRLASLEPDAQFLGNIKKLIGRMFEAEIQTIARAHDLPFRFWLRKNALPFVLMSLPVCLPSHGRSPDSCRRYVGWLYDVGRFFGGLDDTIDFDEDARTGQPNHLLEYDEPLRSDRVPRVADWGTQVLSAWDRLVLPGIDNSIYRETFLHTIWGW